MKLLIRLAVLFYQAVILLLACVLGLVALKLIPLEDVQEFVSVSYQDTQSRLVLGILAVVLVVFNYIFARVLNSLRQRGRMIAFDNPTGRVSVSVNALEDLIKRELLNIHEVKEVRSSLVKTGRKGMEVYTRLVLNADVNIPETTSGLQEMIKSKIQDTIGIEEAIMVVIDVVKIVPDLKKRSKDKDTKTPPVQPVPFQGYRA